MNTEFRNSQYLYGFELYGTAYSVVQAVPYYTTSGVNVNICNTTLVLNQTVNSTSSQNKYYNVTICKNFNNMTNKSSVNYVTNFINGGIVMIQVNK